MPESMSIRPPRLLAMRFQILEPVPSSQRMGESVPFSSLCYANRLSMKYSGVITQYMGLPPLSFFNVMRPSE